jgi:rod shape-determining protein MreD
MISLNFRLAILLLIAFILTIMPMPAFMIGFRPPWVLLLVLFIQLYLPNYFNITVLFILGLCLDILLSTVIGEHVFALLFTNWIANKRERRFKFFSLVQQMLFVGLYCLVYLTIIYLIDSFLGYSSVLWQIWIAVIISMLIWLIMQQLMPGLILLNKNRNYS